MGKAAVVIGATGLVGRALVDQLVGIEAITKVVTLTRRPAHHDAEKVENQVVDFDRLEDYADYFTADMLFSCLGTTLKQAGSIQAQRKVDLDYQLNAAKLALKQGVSHYLLVSSSGANANSRNAYLCMKGELEDRIKALPFPRTSLFQPSLLLGARADFRFGEVLASLLSPVLLVLPWLRRYRPIKGTEVAIKMAQVSQSDGSGLAVFALQDVFVE